MSITVEIGAAIQSQLATAAVAHGLDLAAHAALVPGAERICPDRQANSVTPVDVEAFLERMARFSDRIPHLPAEAFTRENIYRDRD